MKAVSSKSSGAVISWTPSRIVTPVTPWPRMVSWPLPMAATPAPPET